MKPEQSGTTRRILREIQPSELNQSTLAGSNGVISVDKRTGRKRKLYLAAENAVNLPSEKIIGKTSRQTQTISQEAYDLMVKDEVPVEYWKDLAEQRRIALENALKENEELHEQVELLQAENEHLQKLADQALPLAELFKEVASMQ